MQQNPKKYDWWRLIVPELATTAVFLLALLSPLRGLAGGVDVIMVAPSAKELELRAKAPSTPEELLTLIKEWMDNPFMDGYAFGERLAGVPRDKWGPGGNYGGIAGNKIYGAGAFWKKNGIREPLDYTIKLMQITSTNHLWDIIMPLSLDHERFCASAASVQKILGKPSRLRARFKDTGVVSKGPFEYADLIYLYQTDKYKVDVRFEFYDEKLNKERSEYAKGEFKALRAMMEDFDFHKNICARGFRFGTYERNN